MIITCDQCQAKFKVAPESIKETGSKVRCSACRHVFKVYRHQEPPPPRPAKTPTPSEGELDDYLNSYRSPDDDGEAPGGDLFRDKSRLSRSLADDDQDDFEDPEDGLDDFQVDDDGPHLTPPDDARSIRERRERRRRFYSDLQAADETGDDETDGPATDFAPAADDEDYQDEEGDEGEYEDEEYEEDAEYEDGEEYDEEYEEEDYDEEEYDDQDLNRYDLPKKGAAGAGDNDLGLGADPTTVIDDSDYSSPAYGGGFGGGLREPTAIRAAVTKAPGKSKKFLILILAIVAAFLAIGIYFLSSRPERTALSTDEAQIADAEDADEAARASGDPGGVEGITFTRGHQNHYLRDNQEAGKILIITGMVRNSYNDRRNFIRLRGHLLSSEGVTLADRFVYAGNILSEEELAGLPMREIVSRLSIKGGQNNLNMNVEPGAEIPFMLVFNNLPDNMTEYRIDPVGSESAN